MLQGLSILSGGELSSSAVLEPQSATEEKKANKQQQKKTLLGFLRCQLRGWEENSAVIFLLEHFQPHSRKVCRTESMY